MSARTGFSVLVPWRPDEGPRDRILAWNITRWHDLFGASVHRCIGTSPAGPFSVSAARNEAFARSRARFPDDDVIVIADGDTVPIASSVLEAVARARAGVWTVAYAEHRYYNLTSEATERALSTDPGSEVAEPAIEDWEHRLVSCSGMLALPVEAFEAIGGYDEEFIGWGYEDNAFALALDTLWGPGDRVRTGFAVHLWHPVTADGRFNQPDIETNRARYARYEAAAGDPAAMRALLGVGAENQRGHVT